MTDYFLRNVPEDLWHRAKVQAVKNKTTVRQMLLDGLKNQVENNMYPVIIIEVSQNYQDEVDRLAPVSSLSEAKNAAYEAGYTVIDSGEGGQCETSDS